MVAIALAPLGEIITPFDMFPALTQLRIATFEPAARFMPLP